MLNMIYWPLSGIVLILTISHRIFISLTLLLLVVVVSFSVQLFIPSFGCISLDGRPIKCAAIISFGWKMLTIKNLCVKVAGFCRLNLVNRKWLQQNVSYQFFFIASDGDRCWCCFCCCCHCRCCFFCRLPRACCAAKWCPVFTTHYGCGLSCNKLYVSFFTI